jgi:hypothetical protein
MPPEELDYTCAPPYPAIYFNPLPEFFPLKKADFLSKHFSCLSLQEINESVLSDKTAPGEQSKNFPNLECKHP